MFKKFISMTTAAFMLMTGLAVVAAAPATATVYASNAGAASVETRVFVTPDGSGNFSIPSGATSLSANFNLTLSSANAAGFSNGSFYLTGELKNSNNQLITAADAFAIGISKYENAFWSYPGTSSSSSTLPTSTINVSGSITSLNMSSSASLNVLTASALPSGNYSFTAQVFKNGSAYTPSGSDSSFISISYVLTGSTITNPSSNVSSVTQNIVTCVNRSLVSSSDTLTLHLVTSVSTSSIRYRFFSIQSSSVSLSSTNTLSLASVDLSLPLAVSAEHYLSSNANDVTTSDLSVTKGDGTEVSTNCLSVTTPATPTVSFTNSTTLVGSFSTSSASAIGECLLYLASDPTAVIARSSSLTNSTSKTCTFAGRSAGVNYVVKAREAARISYSEMVGQAYFLYRTVNSALSSASASISSTSGSTPAPTTPTLTPEQVAAAAAVAAEAARVAAAAARATEIATAQTKLATVLKSDKPGTLSEFRSANINVTTDAVLTRLNAEILKLSAADRSDFAKIKALADKIEFDESFFNATARPTVATYNAYGVTVTDRTVATINAKVLELPVAKRTDVTAIAEIAKVETFVDRVANPATRLSVPAATLVSKGLLPADSPYKYSVVQGLAMYPEGSLNTLAKIEAAIKAEVVKAGARKAKTEAIKAKIAARKK